MSFGDAFVIGLGVGIGMWTIQFIVELINQLVWGE